MNHYNDTATMRDPRNDLSKTKQESNYFDWKNVESGHSKKGENRWKIVQV